MRELEITYHEKVCSVCFDMAQRGITSESKYWAIEDYDVFDKKYPLKYKLFYIPKKGKNKGIKEYFTQP